jgi:hypothetical protein
MAGANFLTGLGTDADVYLETGSMVGGSPYDGPSATDSAYGPPTADDDRMTSAKIAIMAVVAVAFIIVLRRNGFRDMVAQ